MATDNKGIATTDTPAPASDGQSAVPGWDTSTSTAPATDRSIEDIAADAAAGPDTASDEDAPDTEDTPEEGEGEAGEDVEDSETEVEDLSDEDLEALAESYSDRLLQSKAIKELVERETRRAARREAEEADRTREETEATNRALGQAQQAALALGRSAEVMQRMAKALSDEEVDFPKDGLLSPQDVVNHLSLFGQAAQMQIRNNYDRAIMSGFNETFDAVLPELSDEHAEELQSITNTAQRMKGDPRQADKADGYFLENLFKFVAERAMEHGATQERTKLEKRRSLKDRVADSNAVAAARAKLSKSKAPPKAPPSSPTIQEEFTLDAYSRAKKDGDYGRAQRIADEMAKRGVAR